MPAGDGRPVKATRAGDGLFIVCPLLFIAASPTLDARPIAEQPSSL